MSAMTDLKVMARRMARRAGWLVLLALALPVWAEDTPLKQWDEAVNRIVEQAKLSVVSVRVGPRNGKQTFAPAPPVLSLGGPFSADEPMEAELVLTGYGNGATAIPAPAGQDAFEWKGGDVMTLLQPTRVGTGFVVDGDGVVLTTTDVVGDSKEVSVALSDGREVTGKVLGADGPTGVAVVKVDASNLPALRLAEK